MLTKLGGRWRDLLEWINPAEWLPRLLGLPSTRERGFPPGLLLIELSGCDGTTWSALRARGAFPFLSSLVEQQNYRAVPYHAGCPWSRTLREIELLHGKVAGTSLIAAGDTEHAALLHGGSAWGSLLPGGAAEDEFHGRSRHGRQAWGRWLRNRAGAALDLRRGLPIVYLFHQYAENGAGPAGARRLDRRLARLYHLARRCRRRDYQVWFLLTPGSFSEPTAAPGQGLVHSLQAALGPDWTLVSSAPEEHPLTAASGNGPVLRLSAEDRLLRLRTEKPPDDRVAEAVAARLHRAHPYIHAVLWRESSGKHRLHSLCSATRPGPRSSMHARPAEVPRDLVGEDIASLFATPHADTWILLIGDPGGALHGGLALLPGPTRLPAGAAAWLRPAQIHAAAHHVLDRRPLTAIPRRSPPTLPPAGAFRLATYNVHRCIGMDGRQSVRRILRVLAEIDADLIALQEVSAVGANQATQLGLELGFHVLFCPTLHGDHAYGHALLSRHPIKARLIGPLPLVSEAPYKEPRGAIWAHLSIGTRSLHLFSTHLALGQSDRALQVDTLLGPGWIGALPVEEPLILCGDFNFTPSGRNYRRITTRLRDAQLAHDRGPVRMTFSTVCAVARLDHIFLSPHFTVLDVKSPRTHLTRVASDHYPLVADLCWNDGSAQPSGSGSVANNSSRDALPKSPSVCIDGYSEG
jgi:endonuclease/exonuclease/phosphatase family metal-dependent hydrolase